MWQIQKSYLGGNIMFKSSPFFALTEVPEVSNPVSSDKGFELPLEVSIPIDFQEFFDRVDVAIPNLVFRVNEVVKAQIRNAVVNHLIQNHSEFAEDIIRWEAVRKELWRPVSNPTYGAEVDPRLSYSRDRFDELLCEAESIESKYGCSDPHRELLMKTRDQCESYLDSLEPKQLG